MDNEELIEKLKIKLFKSECDLKTKSATEKHLIYENEILSSERDILIEETSNLKSSLQKMECRIKKLDGDLEDLDELKDANESLINENTALKEDLNKQMNINKQMWKTKAVSDSPNVKFRDAAQKYKCELKSLNDEKAHLLMKIEQLTFDICKLNENYRKEIEIFKDKTDNYKQLLESAKIEKEELENEYMIFQNDVNQPDYKRQGNSLYCEVNDRRIKAEMKVLEYQDELIRLRKGNKELMTLLEKVFDDYKIMKDDDTRVNRTNLIKQVEHLTRENTRFEHDFKTLHKFVEDKIKTNTDKYLGVSVVIDGLTINNQLLKTSVRKLKLNVEDHERTIEAINERSTKLYCTNVELFKKNALHLKSVAEMESKLVCWDRIVPEDKKKEYEEKQKEMEENLTKNHVVKNNVARMLPMTVFGPLYANARHEDVVVFDPFGRLIRNRFTNRLLPKEEVCEEEPEEDEERIILSSIGLIDDMKKETLKEMSQNSNQDLSKENVAPECSEGVENVCEQTPECNVS